MPGQQWACRCIAEQGAQVYRTVPEDDGTANHLCKQCSDKRTHHAVTRVPMYKLPMKGRTP